MPSGSPTLTSFVPQQADCLRVGAGSVGTSTCRRPHRRPESEASVCCSSVVSVVSLASCCSTKTQHLPLIRFHFMDRGPDQLHVYWVH